MLCRNPRATVLAMPAFEFAVIRPGGYDHEGQDRGKGDWYFGRPQRGHLAGTHARGCTAAMAPSRIAPIAWPHRRARRVLRGAANHGTGRLHAGHARRGRQCSAFWLSGHFARQCTAFPQLRFVAIAECATRTRTKARLRSAGVLQPIVEVSIQQPQTVGSPEQLVADGTSRRAEHTTANGLRGRLCEGVLGMGIVEG